MSNLLTRLEVHNFRSLADVAVETGALNVLFGPNGAGKSTLLDTILFMHDCANRDVPQVSSERSYGTGLLWDGAEVGASTSIKIEAALVEYEASFGYSSGRIEPFVGEILRSKARNNICLIDRKIGSDKADFYDSKRQQSKPVTLREPEKLALIEYLYLDDSYLEVRELRKLLQSVHFYHSREAHLSRLKERGSESSYYTKLWDGCLNLWSVLRNLHDRQGVDERYNTILDFMRKSFSSFADLLIEQTGPKTVYGSFWEKGRRQPIPASGVSDGHLQMLAHLTGLFSEGKDIDSLILFDEPETSLHPYALAVFAEAVKLATQEWNRQVFIATHSPVLLSQFDPEDIFAMEVGEYGQTVMTRLSEVEGIKDLLEEYAAGSLYMAEMIARQSRPALAEQDK